MMRMISSVLAVTLFASLSLAAGWGQPGSGVLSQAAPPVRKGEVGVTGKLGRTVEAGGWILKTKNRTYLLLGIKEFRKEKWFREGARVKVEGKEEPDTVTIFMQGMPFRVKKIVPVGEGEQPPQIDSK